MAGDYKEYENGGTKYAIRCVNAYDEEGARDLDISITYLIPSDEAAAEVIETAFGDKAVFDGTAYRIEPGISRKKVLVPAITDVLESHPKE